MGAEGGETKGRDADFSEVTKRTIAGRAGWRCSFPDCWKATIGPGAASDETSLVGQAAHILPSAPGKGPRAEEIIDEDVTYRKSAANGIWLCETHGKLVDKNRGADYPSALLSSYKALRERMALIELSGTAPPAGWIFSATVEQGPVFAPQQTVRLGKVNNFHGEYGAGKTALWEWLASSVDPTWAWRWKKGEPVVISFESFTPRRHTTRVRIDAGLVTYEHDGTAVPVSPSQIRFVLVAWASRQEGEDDLTYLSRLLRTDPDILRNVAALTKEAGPLEMALKFQQDDESRTVLNTEMPGTHCETFAGLSGSEKSRVFLALAVTLAKTFALTSTVVLGVEMSELKLDSSNMSAIVDYLTQPSWMFQTIFIGQKDLSEADQRIVGAEFVKTAGKTVIVQA